MAATRNNPEALEVVELGDRLESESRLLTDSDTGKKTEGFGGFLRIASLIEENGLDGERIANRPEIEPDEEKNDMSKPDQHERDPIFEELSELAREQLGLHGSPIHPPTILRKLYERHRSRGEDRQTFFVQFARAMRKLLIGGENKPGKIRHDDLLMIPVDTYTEEPSSNHLIVQAMELSRALEEMERLDPELARLMELRIFCGYSRVELANLMGEELQVIESKWTLAKNLLYRVADPLFVPRGDAHFRRRIELFRELLEYDNQEWPTMLARRCADDRNLHEDVVSLLGVYLEATRKRAGTATTPTPTEPPRQRRPWRQLLSRKLEHC